MPDLESLSLDQRLALRSAAANLHKEFDGVFGTETIEMFLASSYEQFADQARISDLPGPVRRAFRPPAPQGPGQGRRQAKRRDADRAVPVHPQRRALTDGAWLVQPRSPTRDRLRGPVALNLAWTSTLLPSPRWVRSASTSPASTQSRGPTRSCKRADVVVTMGCGDACPLFPGKRYEDWELEDPAGLDLASVRPIRDEIRTRVENLLAELAVPAQA